MLQNEWREVAARWKRFGCSGPRGTCCKNEGRQLKFDKSVKGCQIFALIYFMLQPKLLWQTCFMSLDALNIKWSKIQLQSSEIFKHTNAGVWCLILSSSLKCVFFFLLPQTASAAVCLCSGSLWSGGAAAAAGGSEGGPAEGGCTVPAPPRVAGPPGAVGAWSRLCATAGLPSARPERTARLAESGGRPLAGGHRSGQSNSQVRSQSHVVSVQLAGTISSEVKKE